MHYDTNAEQSMKMIKNDQKPKKKAKTKDQVNKSKKERSSVQNDTNTNRELKEVKLSSSQEGSRGVGQILGENQEKHHPRTQLSTMTKVSIEGSKWMPNK